MRYLAASRKRILEGSHVECELDFARFVSQCGITDLMNEHPLNNSKLIGLLDYDGNTLWNEADRVRLLAGQYYEGKTSKTEGTAQGVPRSELEKLNHKLDLIAGELARQDRIRTQGADTQVIAHRDGNILTLNF